jgi:hypothetical protein
MPAYLRQGVENIIKINNLEPTKTIEETILRPKPGVPKLIFRE